MPLVLVSEPELAPLTVLGQTADSVTLGLAESSAKVVLVDAHDDDHDVLFKGGPHLCALPP